MFLFSLKEREPKDYASYKLYLVYFGLVDGIFNILYKVTSVVAGILDFYAL